MTLKETGETFRAQVHRIIVGQEETITLSFLALCLGGHVLIEGVPGTAKTLLARTIAQLVGGTFKRIQFTPDLMPSDIVVPDAPRTDLREHRPRRRGEPRTGEDAVRAPRGDGGASGHARRGRPAAP